MQFELKSKQLFSLSYFIDYSPIIHRNYIHIISCLNFNFNIWLSYRLIQTEKNDLKFTAC